ncbi:MAG: ABC transporter permease [Bacilli bacterium]|nr:ABC transporter permease [Bacilli bacterium]
MNILRKFTLRDLKLNKKRTIGTLTGIILSCALIIVVLGMLVTIYNSLFESEVYHNGYYHVRVNNIDKEESENIKNLDFVKDIININNIGYTYYEENTNYTGDVYSMDKDSFDKLSYHIIEGDFPKDENELLINKAFMYEYDLHVGDVFEMKIGEAVDKDYNLVNQRIKKYTISGVIDRYGDLITTNSDSKTINTYVILKNPSKYKTDIPKLLGNNIITQRESKYESFDINYQVLIWETLDFSDQAVKILTSIIGIILFIIIVTSIFAIRNSFAISISEKMKTYGMLSSVGATKKQIRRMVLFEGFVIGLIGISIGILLGVLVNILLVFIINTIANNANLFGEGFQVIYKFSFMPILLSIILSFIVIFLSVITCAVKASRVSPIQNIRNSDDIKAKKLKIPRIVKRTFGIGGVLSYKNLKRSKKKYRVTIVSLTISIFIYIIISTFVEYMLNIIHDEYSSYNYNISVNINSESREAKKTIINKIESLGKAYSNYYLTLSGGQIDFGNHVICDRVVFGSEDEEIVNYQLYLYNDNGFKEYLDRVDLNYNEVKDKLIIVNEFRDKYSEKRNDYIKITDYKNGDLITIGDKKVEVGLVTRERPIGLEDMEDQPILYLIGNVNNFPKIDDTEVFIGNIYFNSDEPYKLVNSLNDLSSNEVSLYIENLDEQVSQMRSFILILSIVVYGFIIVVTFIGITSVFNTINSNMELRSKDFATLKSIGMTKKEFNNMINLEAIFYSVKSLIYGIIFGLIGSYVIWNIISDNYIFEYRAPIKSIFIAILFIVVLILIIMRYSIKKINKQNIIETIRNSNI